MLIPLKVGLIGANGDELPLQARRRRRRLTDGLIEVTDREQIFEFRDVPAPPTPSLLRGFSAPVRLTISLDPDQIEFLMMHDSDPFNRWQAAQTYATNLLTAAARDGGAEARVTRQGGGAACPGARRHRAPMPRSRPAYRAEFLKLPSESDIARELARDVDTDAVRNARETLRATIGDADQAPTLAELYEAVGPKRPLFAGSRERRQARVAQRRPRSARRDRRGVGDRRVPNATTARRRT